MKEKDESSPYNVFALKILNDQIDDRGVRKNVQIPSSNSSQVFWESFGPRNMMPLLFIVNPQVPSEPFVYNVGIPFTPHTPESMLSSEVGKLTLKGLLILFMTHSLLSSSVRSTPASNHLSNSSNGFVVRFIAVDGGFVRSQVDGGFLKSSDGLLSKGVWISQMVDSFFQTNHPNHYIGHQVELKLKLCRGLSARKLLMQEAESLGADTLILGTSQSNKCVSIFVVDSGKVTFLREAAVMPSDQGFYLANPLLLILHVYLDI
ncbi:hypothetical protein PIB30_059386 [Stylosanthes scabra]|uniref:Uncharacterized protein n=1 Tax=Stylosanthes scabra TaxID=79078 RepID=A0ABU6SKK5_9FABA|nr:hypothetical protein [Stylosanthes scabra]